MPELEEIAVDEIFPNPNQPRVEFSEDRITELAENIEKQGLITPILVEKTEKGYQIVAGERRWRAAKKMGRGTIPAVVRKKTTEFRSLTDSLSENIHRKNLTSAERENAIYKLWKIGKSGGKVESKKELADLLGYSESRIKQIIKAKAFRDQEQVSPEISTRSILDTEGLPEEERKKLLKKVEKDKIKTPDLREYVRTVKKASKPVKEALLKEKSKITPEEAKIIEEEKADTEVKQRAIKILEEKKKGESTESDIQVTLKSLSEAKRKLTLERKRSGELKEEESPHIQIWFKEYKQLDSSKKSLVEKVKDGSIIDRFAKSGFPEKKTDVVCPHYLELKWANGCPMNCAWCYLQGTLRHMPDGKDLFVKDLDKIERHVKVFLQHEHEPEILNTGELSDSLVYEGHNPPFSKLVIEWFQQYQNPIRHKVLFLTKTTNVQNILDLEGQDVAIMSFTLNAYPVAKKWEKGAPPVKSRIEAAHKVYEAEYETRIRIDPIVPVMQWKPNYQELIDDLFQAITPERITLGSLRGLQSTINEAEDTSWTKFLSESTSWGKKIPFEERYTIYKNIIEYLETEYGFTDIGLCKETLALWTRLRMEFPFMNYKENKCNCVW